MTTTDVLDLAEAVAEDGFGPHEAAVAALAAGARRRCLSPTLVSVVADPAEPAVARARALGRLLVEWAGVERRTEGAAPAA